MNEVKISFVADREKARKEILKLKSEGRMETKDLVKKINKLNEMILKLNLKKNETVAIELSRISIREKSYNSLELKHFSEEVENGLKIITYINSIRDFGENNIENLFNYLDILKSEGR